MFRAVVENAASATVWEASSSLVEAERRPRRAPFFPTVPALLVDVPDVRAVCQASGPRIHYILGLHEASPVRPAADHGVIRFPPPGGVGRASVVSPSLSRQPLGGGVLDHLSSSLPAQGLGGGPSTALDWKLQSIFKKIQCNYKGLPVNRLPDNQGSMACGCS